MKCVLPILLSIWTMASDMGTGVSAAFMNGGFESGAFEGWHLEIPRGYSSSQPRYRPAGTANIVSSWGQQVGLSPLRAAIQGSRFAVLGSLANGNFTGHRTYHLSVSQEISLSNNETISGWASFFNGDYQPQDAAWVKILDSTGNLVATPWRENSGCVPESDLSSTPYYTATPWSQWFWQAPESGTYTVSLGLTTQGDDNYASYGFFDDIFTVPANLPVPEPSALSLVTSGALLLAGLRRKRH